MKRVCTLSFLMCAFSALIWGQQKMRIATYNVENLFDLQHDSLHEDWAFVEGGEYHWTKNRYWRKLDQIGRVVMAMGQGDMPPAIVGLCEVENDTVMRDLTRRSLLRGAGYEYVMTNCRDRRGIDVALMYQPGLFRLLDYESLRIPSERIGMAPTRDLLHAWGLTRTGDTLHIIECHLPSQTGGMAKAGKHRLLAARTLAHVCDSVLAQWKGRRLVVMGDFNTGPRDRIFKRYLYPLLHTLMPTSSKALRQPHGTYRFQGRWSYLDHILVSKNVDFSDEKGQIGDFPWLLEPDSHGGFHPHRTFGGTSYKGGTSDHLPVYFDLLLPR